MNDGWQGVSGLPSSLAILLFFALLALPGFHVSNWLLTQHIQSFMHALECETETGNLCSCAGASVSVTAALMSVCHQMSQLLKMNNNQILTRPFRRASITWLVAHRMCCVLSSFYHELSWGSVLMDLYMC